ncbi:MAG: MBL fold metallo-hydrolase [Ruminococcus sp.]|nr:MBL fold metallo-hydrolase [Ruminococcus sp.]
MLVVTEKTKPLKNVHYFCALSGGQPVSCYLIKGRYGDMLIDTATPLVYKRLREWLDVNDLKHIFITHAHADHDSNAARIKREYGAEIWLSGADLPLVGHYESQPMKATREKYKLRTVQLNVMGSMKVFNTTPYEPDHIITADSANALREYGFDADIITLPGHTLGSVGVFSEGVLYCGDAFTAMWRRPEISPHASSVIDMKASLIKILELSPEWLCTGHGLPVSMKKARRVIREYLKE